MVKDCKWLVFWFVFTTQATIRCKVYVQSDNPHLGQSLRAPPGEKPVRAPRSVDIVVYGSCDHQVAHVLSNP